MADAHDKCLVVGIAGLSMELLAARLRDGKLPTLAAVAAAGELRPMMSSIPARSPAAWASLSTGLPPGSHGFVLDEEFGPSGPRPAGYASWRSAPFWERLEQVGLTTASVNWPGVVPAAIWQGAHVDARLTIASGVTRDDWPLPLDVAPPSLREQFRSLRVHPTEIALDLLAPFGPSGRELPLETEARLAVVLARLATFQAAVDLVSHAAAWDVLAVYQDWLPSVAAALGCTADMLPDPAWVLLDQSLAIVIKHAPRSSLTIFASIGEDGPGFLLARGRGFTPGHQAQAVSTLAVAPTIFGHFGFASLAHASSLLGDLTALSQLPPAEPRARPPDPDPRDVARIAEFGHHIRRPEPHWCARRLLAEAELILADDPRRAAALAEEALTHDARSLAALGILATSLVTLGDSHPLTDLADRIEAIAPDHLWAHLVRGAYHAMNKDEPAARPHLQRVAAEGNLDEQLRGGAIWLMLGRRAKAADIFRAILAAQPRHFGALVALLSTETVRGSEAEQLLRRVLTIDPTHGPARAALKTLLRSLGRSVGASF